MAKTFDLSTIASSSLGQIRFATGDYDVSDPTLMVLDDELIQFLITQNTVDSILDLRGAAIAALNAIIMQFAKEVAYSKKSISEQANQRYQQFVAERNRLMNGGKLFSSGEVVPTNIQAGGIFEDNNELMARDSNLRQPFFAKYRDDHPGNSSDLSDRALDDPLS